MGFLRAAALFALLAPITGAPAMAAASSQEPDARAILEASFQAMGAVESWRFSGVSDTRVAVAGSSISFAMQLSAEYRAPDRFRIKVDAERMGPSSEAVRVGDRVWSRTGQQPWEPGIGGEFAQGLGPSSFTLANVDMLSYFSDLVIFEAGAGAAYTISSQFDLAAFMEIPIFSSLLGDMDITSMSKFEPRITWTINKSSLLVENESVEIFMAMPRGEISVSMRMTYSDFDSPNIEINPPL